MLKAGLKHECYEGGQLFNSRKYWATQKLLLPLHFGAYVAEVAPKKAAAANLETVFSGAGKFTQEAPTTGATLLQRITKLHYNWKYVFLRPTIEEVVRHYNNKFGTTSSSASTSAQPAAEAAAPTTA